VREQGARLVHDDQAGFVRQRPSHADNLLGGGGETSHNPRDRDVAVAEPVEYDLRLTAHLLTAHEAAGRLLVAEEHVLGDCEVVHQVEFLVDGRDPGLRRGLGRGEGDLFALPQHRTGVRAVYAGHHLDQGGLACAVLTEQAVNLAGANLELYTVQSAYARERLDDPR